MEAVVVALPPESPPARLGERFVIRAGSALRLGPGREARLRLGAPGMGELVIGTEADSPFIKVTAPALRASLCGQPLLGSVQVPVGEGDSLYVHPGLVLEFRSAPPARPSRHRELEAQLLATDEDATWAVYTDYLQEAGDPLAAWLTEAPTADEDARRRQLRGLAESERTQLLQATWSARGLLANVSFTRQAVLGEPGLSWHLEQLARLPVARLLPRLSIGLFAGAAQNHLGQAEAPDALAARTLEQLARLDGANALRSVGLGFVSQRRAWPKAEAAWERLRQVAPRLPLSFGSALVVGARARLSVLSRTTGAQAVSQDVVLNPLRTDVGTDPGCLVRLVGLAPQVACSLFRSNDGQWVVFDESADPFRQAAGPFALRVNGAVVRRAALAPGDVVEPVEGLRFLFDVGEG